MLKRKGQNVFIFYDTETSGLDKDYTQILQIALVFTDDNLNILSSKRLECRRSPWTIPSPASMLITGFSPDDLKNSKLSHFEMMHEVYDWVRAQNWPVIFGGYNTLGYDEDIFEQNLYQNLLPKNLTTAANSKGQTNGRCDVMSVVKATVAYAPGALVLKTENEFKTPSISLLNVAEQNGVTLSGEDAHDAMNDIRATIGVAKVLQKTVPHIWEQMLRLSNAEGVTNFTSTHKVFTHATVSKAVVKGAVVTELYDGMLCNLSVDPATYIDKTAEELKDMLFAKGQTTFRAIDKSKQPILMPLEQSDAVIPADYDDALYAARAERLRNDAGFIANLKEARGIYESYRASKNIKSKPWMPEQAIDIAVDPVTTAKLERWMEDFRNAADWTASAAILDDFYVRFGEDLKNDDGYIRRFAKLAGRIVYEHAPEMLSPEKQDLMRLYVATRALNPDENSPYMTIPKARKELEEIEKKRTAGDPKWAHVTDGQIRSLKLYYTALEKESAPYASRISTPPVIVDKTAKPPKPDAPKP